MDEQQAALVFAQPGWHLGVVGIVASRLVERFSRPVFVLSTSRDEGCLSGSGRSIPAFHLLEALGEHAGSVHQVWWPPASGGSHDSRRQGPTFRQRFTDFANQKLAPGDLVPSVHDRRDNGI